MRAIVGYIVGGVLALVGLSTLISSLSLLSRGGPNAGFVILMCCLGLAFIFWGWTFAGRPGVAGRRASSLGAEANAWYDHLRQSLAFPVVDAGGLMLPRGERPLLSEPSTLIVQRTQTSRGYVGTRVKIGGMPFYLGRSDPISKKVLRTASQGRLTLTDRGIYFIGEGKTIDVDLRHLMSLEPCSTDGILVAARGKASPAMFTVRNPIIWTIATKVARQVPLQDGRVPDAAMLQ